MTNALLKCHATGYGLALLLCSLGVSALESAPELFQVCIDYHCDYRKPVQLAPAQWQDIRVLMADSKDAAEERQRIGDAIARLEQLVGEQAGTSVDREKNQGEGSELGQLDCIAESLNTTTYLQLMSQDKLLKWHSVQGRERRNYYLFGAHWTAAIQENGSNQVYAVDSWVLVNGQPPLIEPMELWRKE